MKETEKNANGQPVKRKMNVRRAIAITLAVSMTLSTAGCGSSGENNNSTSAQEKSISEQEASTSDAQIEESSNASEQETETLESSNDDEVQESSDQTEAEKRDYEIVEAEEEEDEELTEQQRNAINMLNHMTVLTQEVNDSKESRLFLESAYSSLINNTYPNAVDIKTESQMTSLLDTMEQYRMITVKRERLKYIYEQNKAQAMKAAIPNPVALLSVVESGNLLKEAASVVYMAVDAASSYQSASSQADLQYLQDGWELDDSEAEELHNSRKTAFSYMMNMARDNSLPGDYALSEEAVGDFVDWKNETNIPSKIQWFEDNEKTYKKFGPYWLELAKDYYDSENYEKCLKSIEQYNSVTTRILRKDYDYAKIMPLAIISAKETMNQGEYVEIAEKCIGSIVDNTDDNDWSLRYFASQIYLDLYKETSDKKYIQSAYDICRNNVNVLVKEQKQMNEEYLADVKEEKIPDDATKQEKKEIKNYNKYLKNQRKKALPPVDESLYLNCELLFALADQLDVSEVEQQKIDSILHGDGEPLFLTSMLDEKFWFGDSEKKAVNIDKLDIEFDGDKLIIPTACVSEQSIITVKVNDKSIDDWSISKVKRPKKSEVSEYIATYESDKAEKHKYKVGDKITVQIKEDEESSDVEEIKFTAVEGKKAFVLKGIKFERNE